MTASLTVRVARKSLAAPDICLVELVPADEAALPGFTAGAHIDVQLPGGLTRQYSLCNPPDETHRYQIGVLRDPASRGGSVALHDRVQVGEQLRISPPRNQFPLAGDGGRSLLLAGGIGVTPILSMAEALQKTGADFDMHYCARSRRRAAFLPRLAEAPFATRVHLHFDDEAPAQRLDIAALLARTGPEAHLYVCGPAGFIDAALGAGRAAGWPERRLHWERFTGAVPAPGGEAAFEVELRRSGRVVPVAADTSIVQALRQAGIEIPTSCEQGICGTCLTPVLAGEPEHRDLYLTPEEQAANGLILPCCSRSRSARLVLDL